MNETTVGQYTPRAQQVIALAQKEADMLQHKSVGPEHLLLGIVKLGQGVANNTLTKMGFDLEELRIVVERGYNGLLKTDFADRVEWTPRTRKVLALAVDESKQLGHTYVGTEHILLAILNEGASRACDALKKFDAGLNLELVRDEVLKELDPSYQSSSANRVKEIMAGSIELSAKGVVAVSRFSDLRSVKIMVGEKEIQVSPQFAAVLLAFDGSKQVVTLDRFIKLGEQIKAADTVSKPAKS